jgi:hypothetical protein
MIAEPDMPATLGDLVTDQQAQEICNILNAQQDSIKRVRELTRYLSGFRAELEKKGILPEYLAYAIEAHNQTWLAAGGKVTRLRLSCPARKP